MPPRIDAFNPSRTTCMDAIMNQLPKGDIRGFVMFFNQTDNEITEDVTLPVYYTGLSDLNMPPAPFENTKNSDVRYPLYGEEIAPLVIRARDGSARTYITDEKVEDKPIPALKQAALTDSSILICENDKNPVSYRVDSNANVHMKLTLPAMSYKWFVLRAPKEENDHHA